MTDTNLQFEQLTKGLTTKSDKIRALARHGVKTAEIARYLDIKYQHARNVLIEGGLHTASNSTAPTAAASPLADDKEKRSLWTEIGTNGAVVIPSGLLRQAGLAAGDRVYIGVTGDGLEFVSRTSALNRAQKIAEPYKKPGFSVVDDFLANRRKDWGEE